MDNQQPSVGTCVAIYAFHGSHSGDLSFDSGAKIQLLKKINDEWYTGQIGNREGIFPADYVDVTEDLTEDTDNDTEEDISAQPSTPWKSLSQLLKDRRSITFSGDNKTNYVTAFDGVGVAPKDEPHDQIDGKQSNQKPEKDTVHLTMERIFIGEGGFSKCYYGGMSTQVGKICLKQAKGKLSWKALVNEKAILDKLKHPNIVRCLFWCKYAMTGDQFIGLDFFNGKDLHDLVAKEERRDAKLSDIHQYHISQILKQIANAITYLQGLPNGAIMHRDISPANILYDEQTYQSMLIDFGLACLVDDLGKKIKGGTPEYLPPEALLQYGSKTQNINYTAAFDIFGLGATVDYLITLQEPWFSLDSVHVVRHGRGFINHYTRSKQEAIDGLTREMLGEALRTEIENFRSSDKGTSAEMAIQIELSEDGKDCDLNLRNFVKEMLWYDIDERMVISRRLHDDTPNIPQPTGSTPTNDNTPANNDYGDDGVAFDLVRKAMGVISFNLQKGLKSEMKNETIYFITVDGDEVEYGVVPGEAPRDQIDGKQSNLKQEKATVHLQMDRSCISEGRFAKLYSGMMITQDLKRKICLKQAKEDRSLKALVNEKEMLEKLNHPNIISCLFGFKYEETGDQFIGLDYFNGVDLHYLVAKEERRDAKLSDIHQYHISQILKQMANAISYLQVQGLPDEAIIHRDFSPANILYNEQTYQSMLIDFRLACCVKDLGKEIEGGTPEYLPPEALLQDRSSTQNIYTEAFDVYGLGATLGYLITLQKPWFSLESVQLVRHGRGCINDFAKSKQEAIDIVTGVGLGKALRTEIENFRSSDKGTSAQMAIQIELSQDNKACDGNLKDFVQNMLWYNPDERMLFSTSFNGDTPNIPLPTSSTSTNDSTPASNGDNPVTVSGSTSFPVGPTAFPENSDDDEDVEFGEPGEDPWM